MRNMLHDVSPTDPITFAAVGAGLAVVAILASLVPAWRATRVDPVVALKAE
jgi:ABC-type lipoprotein release transport system permease subunit